MFSELAFINIAVAGRGDSSALTQIGVSCYDLGLKKISRIWHRYIYEGVFTFQEQGSRREIAMDLMEAKTATMAGLPIADALIEMNQVLSYNKHSVIGSNDKEDKIMICSFNATTVYQNLFIRQPELIEMFHSNVLDLHSICYFLHSIGRLPKIDSIASLTKEFGLQQHINPTAPIAMNYSVVMAHAYAEILKLIPPESIDIPNGLGLQLIKGGKYDRKEESSQKENSQKENNKDNTSPEGPARA